MCRSEPTPAPAETRTDLRPSALGEQINVFCTHCGAYRLTTLPHFLPPPGQCLQCKARDPKRYWSRDWEKSND